MEIKSDHLRVVTTDEVKNITGEKVEPEQAPMQRVMGASMPLTMQGGPSNGLQGNINGQMTYDMQVGDFAAAVRQRCAHCVHFDQLGWQKLHHELRVEKLGDPASQAFLNQMRAAIDQVTDDDYLSRHYDPSQDDIDIDSAMRDLGLCQAMTSIQEAWHKKRHPVVVAPEASCPDEIGPDGTDFSKLFRAKSRESRRLSGKMHSFVMRLATGTKRLVFGPRMTKKLEDARAADIAVDVAAKEREEKAQKIADMNLGP